MLLPCAESAAKTVRTAISVGESRVFHPFRGPPLLRNSIEPLFPNALALALDFFQRHGVVPDPFISS